jgi:hypothetical protein
MSAIEFRGVSKPMEAGPSSPGSHFGSIKARGLRYMVLQAQVRPRCFGSSPVFLLPMRGAF